MRNENSDYSGHLERSPVLVSDVAISSIPKQVKSKYSIYPNPTENFITIDGPDFQEVRIYDLSGKILGRHEKSFVNLNHYPSGLLIVEIVSEEDFEIIRLVKK